MENNIIQELRNVIEHQWAPIKQGLFYKLIREIKIDKELYHDLMIEIYHYTKHNSANQAMACMNIPTHASAIQKFIYRHALEEYGHEKMVLRDLESINILDQTKLTQPPLPATDALIGYLYAVPQRYGAVARLGYSQWAENAYGHINEVTSKIRQDLSLEDKNMSFFVNHSVIDQKHSAEVAEAINTYCTSSEDKVLIKRVAQTTLYLTGKMLDGIAENYLQNRIRRFTHMIGSSSSDGT